ncbi:hypothetical protein AB0C90_24245 [Streptomyces sp. NPDC048550]|uniref:hypothetical protein n=1 Tax=unclassified Streptomyces TaxID=2593676 RepID=UPI003447D4BB
MGALALSPTVGGTIGMSASAADGGDKKGREKAAVTRQAVVFHDQMRKLWEDHITWTRLTIVSFAAGLPDWSPPSSGCCATRSTWATRSSPTSARRPGTS